MSGRNLHDPESSCLASSCRFIQSPGMNISTRSRSPFLLSAIRHESEKNFRATIEKLGKFTHFFQRILASKSLSSNPLFPFF